MTGPDQVDSILARLQRFDPQPISYEPEIQKLTFIIVLDASPNAVGDVDFALAMNFMRGNLPVLTWQKSDGVDQDRFPKVCYGHEESGRRYRYYPYGPHRNRFAYIDPEPQAVEAARAA